MRVFVYFNLHRKCWSVKALEGQRKGRVVYHLQSLRLYACEFKVSEAGRQRVIREGRKNVHAGIVGYLSHTAGTLDLAGYVSVPVTYNPYRYSSFVRKRDEAPVNSAEWVTLHGDRSVVAWRRAA